MTIDSPLVLFLAFNVQCGGWNEGSVSSLTFLNECLPLAGCAAFRWTNGSEKGSGCLAALKHTERRSQQKQCDHEERP